MHRWISSSELIGVWKPKGSGFYRTEGKTKAKYGPRVKVQCWPIQQEHVYFQ